MMSRFIMTVFLILVSSAAAEDRMVRKRLVEISDHATAHDVSINPFTHAVSEDKMVRKKTWDDVHKLTVPRLAEVLLQHTTLEKQEAFLEKIPVPKLRLLLSYLEKKRAETSS